MQKSKTRPINHPGGGYNPKKQNAKTKKQETAELSKLIEMQPPYWLTSEIYNQYHDLKDVLRTELRIRTEVIEMFGDYRLDEERIFHNPTWKSYSFQASPKILVDLYGEGRIISDPGTGQDPKLNSGPNRKTASNHAARQWGWTPHYCKETGEPVHSKSEWIEYGTFNLVKYIDTIVLEPCNVEHRNWGLVGFPLNLIPIDYNEDLWYYDNNLPELHDPVTNQMVRRMKVIGLKLSEIVEKARELGCLTTKEKVLKTHFYSNNFNFTILPFYGKEDCERYFQEVNTSSAKKIPQLFHAESEPIMGFAKNISSPKCVNFTPMNAKYHPLFETMSKKELIKLEALMYTFEVINFVDNGYKPISTSDFSLVDNYKKTNGYANFFKSEEFDSVLELLDWLYSLISKRNNPKLSRQFIQQLLLLGKHLEDNNFVILDTYMFINDFYKFYNDEQETDNDELTSFGRDVRTGSARNAKDAHSHVKRNFLKMLSDEDYLREIGIVPTSNKLKRTFSKDVILDSLEDNSGLDMDGEVLTTEPVGAHCISEMELSRMTDEQRDIAFMEEGLGNKFNHDLNCRASSVYHNNRMGVLRLSEYLKVIDDETLVRKARLAKYYKLKEMPIVSF